MKKIYLLGQLVTLAVAFAQNQPVSAPSVPPILVPPAGHTPFLKTSASGTQNYVCLPSPTGPAWRFLGPQATLFVPSLYINGQGAQQVITHFLSSNPDEVDLARPTWQSSFDTSKVWAKAIQTSTDPSYVAAGSVPWLLLEIVGTRPGPSGGQSLSQTKYMQRINTSGGVAPVSGCDELSYGRVTLVPYTTDYYFYRAGN